MATPTFNSPSRQKITLKVKDGNTVIIIIIKQQDKTIIR